MSRLLLYGSYGFVGNLISREAVARDIDVVLAGRDAGELAEQAADLDQPSRCFDLDDPATVAASLSGVDCVLNCAGPFSNTAETLVSGCLRSGTDYVDITGEIPVIERIHERGWEATEAGVTLLPSVGFSSVAMDCLAAHLADRLPSATVLTLGVDSVRIPSIGSLKTAIEGIDTGGAIRRDGQLKYVPAAWRTRHIDFGRGRRPAATMPMGDLSTAHYTTGIPNVEVYTFVPPPGRLALQLHQYVAPLLATKPMQQLLKGIAEFVREGPSKRARQRGTAFVWGEAHTSDGHVVSRLKTPDAYVVTPDAAVTAAQRVLAGEADDGYQTPAGAFGPEFVFEIDGVTGFFDESYGRLADEAQRVGEW